MTLGYSLALPLGGGPDDIQVAQAALLEVLRPYLEPTDPAQIAQTNGEALAIAITWAVNRRLAGQLDPNRMIETLPQWEQACGLRPAPTDTDTDRRNALAAQFLGFIGNTISDLYGICVAIAGPTFLGFYLPTSSAPTYTPGLLPGPPGWETTSCRATIGVRLQPVGSADAEFLDTIRTLTRQLGLACPAWMGFVVGSDEGGFVMGVGTMGQTLIMP
jgi:hypothetical protein